jgi:hypothetical protein
MIHRYALVPGKTLRDTIGRRSLTAQLALDYARQIALALDAAHEQNIVHRDLKPAGAGTRTAGSCTSRPHGA